MRINVNELNKLGIVQMYFPDEFGEELSIPKKYRAVFNDDNLVSSGLGVDKHRHYETSLNVYEYNGRYFGVRLVSDIFDEMGELELIQWTAKFYEMKQVMKPSYSVIED